MSQTKLCPVCETENELGAKHCEVCGEPLSIPQGGAAAGAPVPSAAALDDDAPPANPSQPEARSWIDAGVPGSADELARSVPSSFDDASPGVRPDDRSALDRFDELLSTEGDVAAEASAGFAREQHDTVVELPPVKRLAPPPPAAAPAATPAPRPTAHLVVYQNRQPVHTYDVITDETLIGRGDPTSDAYPDLDLTPWDAQTQISRKHAWLLREGGRYFVRPLSNAGTQLNRHILELGQKTEIENGDVLILGGALAMKFELG